MYATWILTTYNQRDFSKAIDRQASDGSLSTDDIVHRARMQCTRNISAADWLNALPNYGNRFTTPQFAKALSLWLGLPVLDREQQCKRCNQVMDIYGHHGFRCKQGGSIGRRHNGNRDIIHKYMSKAHWSPEKEKMHLWDGQDVYVRCYDNGRPFALDCAIFDRLQSAHVHTSL